MRRSPVSLTALAFAALAACADESSHAPVARIAATPRAIAQHDDFQTDVVLDGTASTDPIDDPDGTRPLAYRWEITNDDVELRAGSLASPKITVRLLGDHPATVRLTVTDAAGQAATARLQLQLTIP
jgi:hypothetical protein